MDPSNRYYLNNQNLRQTSMPIEVALARHDDVVRLLVALGADVNQPTRDTCSSDIISGRMTSLDFVRVVATELQEKLSETANTKSAASRTTATSSVPPLPLGSLLLPVLSGSPSLLPAPQVKQSLDLQWKTKFLEIVTEVNRIQASTYTPAANQNPDIYADLKAYYEETTSFFTSHGAKTALELEPTDRISEVQRADMIKGRIYAPQNYNYAPQCLNTPYSFWRLGLQGTQIAYASALNGLYEELYTACWEGDNEKIQKLCLPQDGPVIADTPIAIAVRWGDNWRGESLYYISIFALAETSVGYTPLHIALMQRNWDTARLILAIATAQYKPEEPKEAKFRKVAFDGAYHTCHDVILLSHSKVM